MESATEGFDPTLPLDFDGSTNLHDLPRLSLDNQSYPPSSTSPVPQHLTIMGKSGSGRMSPVRGRTMKEYDQQITDLKKENFSLKLRIYFLEDRMQQKFGDGDVFKTNIELKMNIQSLTQELADKQELLHKASQAMETLTSNQQLEMETLRKEIQKENENHFKELRNDLQKALQDAENLRQQRDDSEHKMSALKEQLLQLESELQQGHINRKRLKDTIDRKEREVVELSQEVDEKAQALNEALKTLKEAEAQREAAQLRAQQVEKDLERRGRDVEDVIEDQKEDLKQLKVRINELEVSLQTKDEMIAHMEDGLRDKEKTLKDAVNRAEQLVSELEEEKEYGSRRDKTIQGLLTALHKKEKQMNNLKEKLEKNKTALKSVQDELQEKEMSRQKLQEQLSDHDSNNHRLEVQLNEANNTVEDMIKCLGKKDGELAGFQEQLQKANQALKSSEETLEALQAQLEKERERSISQMDSQTKHYQQMFEDYAHQLESKDGLMSQMTAQLLAKDQQLAAFMNLLTEDCNKSQKALLQHLEDNLTNTTNRLQSALEEKQMQVEKNAVALRDAQQALQEKSRELDQASLKLLEKQEELEKLQMQNREFSEVADLLTSSLAAAQRALKENMEEHHRAMEDKDLIVRRLQNSLREKELMIEELNHPDRTEGEQQKQLKMQLHEKEQLIVELQTERIQSVRQQEEVVQNLQARLKDKENDAEALTKKQRNELLNRDRELQDVMMQLNKKELQLQWLETRMLQAEEQQRQTLDRLNRMMNEKDKTVEALVDSVREREHLLRRSQQNLTEDAKTQLAEMDTLMSENARLQRLLMERGDKSMTDLTQATSYTSSTDVLSSHALDMSSASRHTLLSCLSTAHLAGMSAAVLRDLVSQLQEDLVAAAQRNAALTEQLKNLNHAEDDGSQEKPKDALSSSITELTPASSTLLQDQMETLEKALKLKEQEVISLRQHLGLPSSASGSQVDILEMPQRLEVHTQIHNLQKQLKDMNKVNSVLRQQIMLITCSKENPSGLNPQLLFDMAQEIEKLKSDNDVLKKRVKNVRSHRSVSGQNSNKEASMNFNDGNEAVAEQLAGIPLERSKKSSSNFQPDQNWNRLSSQNKSGVHFSDECSPDSVDDDYLRTSYSELSIVSTGDPSHNVNATTSHMSEDADWTSRTGNVEVLQSVLPMSRMDSQKLESVPRQPSMTVTCGLQDAQKQRKGRKGTILSRSQSETCLENLDNSPLLEISDNVGDTSVHRGMQLEHKMQLGGTELGQAQSIIQNLTEQNHKLRDQFIHGIHVRDEEIAYLRKTIERYTLDGDGGSSVAPTHPFSMSQEQIRQDNKSGCKMNCLEGLDIPDGFRADSHVISEPTASDLAGSDVTSNTADVPSLQLPLGVSAMSVPADTILSVTIPLEAEGIADNLTYFSFSESILPMNFDIQQDNAFSSPRGICVQNKNYDFSKAQSDSLDDTVNKEDHGANSEETERLRHRVSVLNSVNRTLQEELAVYDRLCRSRGVQTSVLGPDVTFNESQVGESWDGETKLLQRHLSELRKLRTRLEQIDADAHSAAQINSLLNDHYTQRIQELEATLAELRNKLAELETLTSEHQQTILERERIITETNVIIKHRESEVIELNERLSVVSDQKERQVESLEVQIQDLTRNLSEALEEVRSLESTLAESDRRSKDFELQLCQLQQDAESLKTQLSQHQTENKTLETQLIESNQREKALEVKLSKSLEQHQSLDLQLHSAKQHVAALETELQNLQTELKDQVAGVKVQEVEWEQKLAQCQECILNYEKCLAEYQKRTAIADENMQRLQESLGSSQSLENELRSELTQARSQIEDLHRRWHDAEDQARSNESIAHKANLLIRTLEGRARDLEGRAKEAEEKLHHIQLIVQEEQASSHQKSATIEKLQQEAEERSAKLRKRDAQLRKLVDEYKKVIAGHKEITQLNRTLKCELNLYENMYNEAEASQDQKKELMRQLLYELSQTRRLAEDLIHRLEHPHQRNDSPASTNTGTEAADGRPSPEPREGLQHTESHATAESVASSHSELSLPQAQELASEQSHLGSSTNNSSPTSFTLPADSGEGHNTMRRSSSSTALWVATGHQLTSTQGQRKTKHSSLMEVQKDWSFDLDDHLRHSFSDNRSLRYWQDGPMARLVHPASSLVEVDSDIRRLFAVGGLEGYEKLRKENSELLCIVSSMQARMTDRLKTFADAPISQSLEYSTLRELQMSTQNLRLCIEEEARILGGFWLTQLPPLNARGEFYDPKTTMENETLKLELHKSRSRYELLTNTVRDQQERLHATNTLRKKWETTLYKQLRPTMDVLEAAKENFDAAGLLPPKNKSPPRKSPRKFKDKN